MEPETTGEAIDAMIETFMEYEASRKEEETKWMQRLSEEMERAREKAKQAFLAKWEAIKDHNGWHAILFGKKTEELGKEIAEEAVDEPGGTKRKEGEIESDESGRDIPREDATNKKRARTGAARAGQKRDREDHCK